MDPGSRRYFWNLIKRAQEFGITIILTSHSMEECEALCSNFGIMSKGQFQCLGTSQHVKNKYGSGLYFSIKKFISFNADNSVEQFIFSNIPKAVLKGKQNETLFFQTDCLKIRMADIYLLLEKCRDQMKIESFSISHTTLEQIFFLLANNETKQI